MYRLVCVDGLNFKQCLYIRKSYVAQSTMYVYDGLNVLLLVVVNCTGCRANDHFGFLFDLIDIIICLFLFVL